MLSVIIFFHCEVYMVIFKGLEIYTMYISKVILLFIIFKQRNTLSNCKLKIQ